MKQSIIIFFFACVTAAGCSKFIDEPDNSILSTEQLLRTTRDLDNVLYGAYGALASDETLAGNWRVIPELLADQVVVNVSQPTATDPYTELYDRNMAAAVYEKNWQQAYTALQNVNTVLYAIDKQIVTSQKDPEFNDGARDRIRGEALFIRGLVNFELIRLYGHQYGFNSGAANSGIVMRTEPVINITTPAAFATATRGTVDAAYAQVISDLEEAETLLPEIPLRRGRATAYAAAAYLARVYFQQQNYPKCLEQVNKVIGSTPGIIETQFVLQRSPQFGKLTAAQASANVIAPFNSSSTTDKPTENIFDLVSVTNDPVNGLISRKYIRTGAIEPHLAISNAFIAEAAFANNDARLVNLITRANSKAYSKKYDRSLMNIPVIRSAELLLDRAEINAMAGNTADAAKDINWLRYRAIPNYDSTTVITPENILAEVRRERVRELCFEGDRLHDLRRRNADIPAGDRAGVPPLAWNANGLLFKFPTAEVLASKGGVVQNPD